MSSKKDLLDRLKYLDTAINIPSVIDEGIETSQHNGAANLLRKGLGIVAFNILEDFIKANSLEALNKISSSGGSYSKLPDKLQEAATLGALKALAFRARLEKKDEGDWKKLIHEEALKIHSTGNETYEISKFSLASENSNISGKEVGEILQAFGIKGGWAKLKVISDAINGGVTDLSQSYNNAAERRHNAAHTANFRYEYSWLEGIKVEIISIAASLDILLTSMCRLVCNDTSKKLTDHNIDNAINYRFLINEDGSYKEKLGLESRSRKNWDDLSDAICSLKPSLAAKNEFLIILDNKSRIIDWHS